MEKNNYHIHYEVCGNENAKHTIIFAHGNGNSVKDWHDLGYVEKLSPNFKLVLMDALGYGQSDKPTDPSEYTPERRAEDVMQVLDAVKIDQAHFLGLSVGGSLGFVLADLYPQRFCSFMIGSAHAYGSNEPDTSNLFGETFRKVMHESGIEVFVDILEKKYLGYQFDTRIRFNYLQNDARALAAANTPVWPSRFDRLKNIAVPVLLFAGEQEPIASYQDKMAQEINNAEVLILPETDHAGVVWNFDQTCAVVKAFIERNFS